MPVMDPLGAARSTLDEVFKEFYVGPVRGQLNNETLLARRLQRNEENVEGRTCVIPLHTGRTRAIQATIEGGLLPLGDRQRYTDMRFDVAYNYATIRVNGPAMAMMRTKRGAFLQLLDSEIQGAVRDFKVDRNRQMWSDGSGRLATVKSVAAPVITVQGVWDSGDQHNRVKFLEVGDRVAFEDRSAAGGVLDSLVAGNTYVPITSIDHAAKTVTFASVTVSPAAGDHLVKGPDETTTIAFDDSNFRGTTGSSNPGTKKELMGLVGICNGPNGWSDDSIAYSAMYGAGGNDVSVYAGSNSGATVGANLQGVHDPIWASNMFFNSGTPRILTSDLMQRAFDAGEEIGQATPTIIITSYAVRRRYLDLLVPDRRYVNANTYKLDGGFEALDYNNVPVVVDKDCPEASMFFLSEPNLAIYRASDFYWLEHDNSILKWIPQRDAWEAVLACYDELATDRRNAHSVIGDIDIAA